MGGGSAHRSPFDRSARRHEQVVDGAGDYSSAIELLSDAPHNETLTLDLALAYGKAKNARQSVRRCSPRRLERNPSSLPLTSALVTVLCQSSALREAVNLAAKVSASSSQ